MFGRNKKTAPSRVCAVIVAAGSSQRMGGENKLLLPLCGCPVLAHTLTAFEESAVVSDIVLVCREQDIAPYTRLAEQQDISKLRIVVRGGESRLASVLSGVQHCPQGTELVAIHDGARPMVPQRVIADAVNAARECGAAAPVIPVKDSIKRMEGDVIAADVRRDVLAAVQTPQVFRLEIIREALETAARLGRVYTDDCAAVEAFGIHVRGVRGDETNLKITTPTDLLIAEAFRKGREEE